MNLKKYIFKSASIHKLDHIKIVKKNCQDSKTLLKTEIIFKIHEICNLLIYMLQMQGENLCTRMVGVFFGHFTYL